MKRVQTMEMGIIFPDLDTVPLQSGHLTGKPHQVVPGPCLSTILTALGGGGSIYNRTCNNTAINMFCQMFQHSRTFYTYYQQYHHFDMIGKVKPKPI